MFTKPLALLIASLAVTLAIVACGADPTPTAPPANTPVPTSTPVPPTETPGARCPGRLHPGYRRELHRRSG